jgi:hypothetical protein
MPASKRRGASGTRLKRAVFPALAVQVGLGVNFQTPGRCEANSSLTWKVAPTGEKL